MRGACFWILCWMVLVGSAEMTGADENLRCGARLISIGFPMSEVLAVCGEPQQREQWLEHPHSAISRIFDYKTGRYQLPRLIHGPLRMERWTYDLGANQFIRYLEFENETLIRIRTGDKGHH